MPVRSMTVEPGNWHKPRRVRCFRLWVVRLRVPVVQQQVLRPQAVQVPLRRVQVLQPLAQVLPWVREPLRLPAWVWVP